MRAGDGVPHVAAYASLAYALLEMIRKRLGMTAIFDGDGRLLGLYTDGDLRRTLADPAIDVHRARIADVMTRSPVAIEADALASEAARLMEDRKITMLPVVDTEQIGRASCRARVCQHV